MPARVEDPARRPGRLARDRRAGRRDVDELETRSGRPRATRRSQLGELVRGGGAAGLDLGDHERRHRPGDGRRDDSRRAAARRRAIGRWAAVASEAASRTRIRANGRATGPARRARDIDDLPAGLSDRGPRRRAGPDEARPTVVAALVDRCTATARLAADARPMHRHSPRAARDAPLIANRRPPASPAAIAAGPPNAYDAGTRRDPIDIRPAPSRRSPPALTPWRHRGPSQANRPSRGPPPQPRDLRRAAAPMPTSSRRRRRRDPAPATAARSAAPRSRRRPAGTGPAPGARPARHRGAFRSSFRPLDLRGDLRALPQIVTPLVASACR